MLNDAMYPRPTDDATARYLKQQYQHHASQLESAQAALAHLEPLCEWKNKNPDVGIMHARNQHALAAQRIASNTTRMEGIESELERMATDA